MSGLDSSDQEELDLMHHIQSGNHDWVYAGFDEHRGNLFERYKCGHPGCHCLDYRILNE